MENLIALLLWLTGQPPQQPPVDPNPGTVTPLGGGIPVQPGLNTTGQ